MDHVPTILAYFGPEVQLPLISLIGSIVGVVMVVGTYPFRVIRDGVRRWKDASASRESKT